MTQQTIIANERYALTTPHFDGKIGDVLISVRHSPADSGLYGSDHWVFDMINGKGLRVIPTSKVALCTSK